MHLVLADIHRGITIYHIINKSRRLVIIISAHN